LKRGNFYGERGEKLATNSYRLKIGSQCLTTKKEKKKQEITDWDTGSELVLGEKSENFLETRKNPSKEESKTKYGKVCLGCNS